MAIANEDQAAYWNGDEGSHWVTGQSRYEGMLEPFVDVVLDAAELASGDRVLDIGCGSGATTLAAARRVAPAGTALGVDISAPLLECARRGAESTGVTNASFMLGDAQVAALDPQAHDAALSRFGVMFFEDPVAAFANIRGAVRPGGRLAFVAWRPVSENEWFSLPMRTFADFAPPGSVPAGPPAGPGPFAFADEGYVRHVLTDAGWRAIDIATRDVDVLYGGRGTIDDVVHFVETGRAGKLLLSQLDAATRGRALDALRRAFEPYATKDGVGMTAAAWVVTASA